MWVMGMNMNAMRFIAVLSLAITLGACGGGGGGGGGAGLDGEGFDGAALMTADLSGSQRARPNATMGALEAY